MKVLFALPFPPLPANFGGAMRMFHLLNQVALHHEVTVLGYGNLEDKKNLLEAMPLKEVHLLPYAWKHRHRRLGQLYSCFTHHSFFQQSVTTPTYGRALNALLDKGAFDIVHTEFSHFGPFKMQTKALKVLDAHNVEWDNFRRMYEASAFGLKKLHYWAEYKKQRSDELKTCLAHDGIVTTSARDLELLGQYLPKLRGAVVPNGVDLEYFRPSPCPPKPLHFVFTGMMAYVPNHDGVGWFLDHIWPRIVHQRPEARFTIVGKNPPPFLLARQSESVRVTGTVEDVRPYVDEACVYVVPLRMGGGTRLKIAEAMAMKKPMVTTRIGCEGIALTHEKTALLEDTPEGFANACLRLAEDETLQKRLAEEAFQMACAHFGWQAIGKALLENYEKWLSEKG
ncbi:MAG: glycosyltransferase [Cystobacterineae bacterium]|nr:glycosyltransferase [Cystobacterineae bacterium]